MVLCFLILLGQAVTDPLTVAVHTTPVTCVPLSIVPTALDSCSTWVCATPTLAHGLPAELAPSAH